MPPDMGLKRQFFLTASSIGIESTDLTVETSMMGGGGPTTPSRRMWINSPGGQQSKSAGSQPACGIRVRCSPETTTAMVGTGQSGTAPVMRCWLYTELNPHPQMPKQGIAFAQTGKVQLTRRGRSTNLLPPLRCKHPQHFTLKRPLLDPTQTFVLSSPALTHLETDKSFWNGLDE